MYKTGLYFCKSFKVYQQNNANTIHKRMQKNEHLLERKTKETRYPKHHLQAVFPCSKLVCFRSYMALLLVIHVL